MLNQMLIENHRKIIGKTQAPTVNMNNCWLPACVDTTILAQISNPRRSYLSAASAQIAPTKWRWDSFPANRRSAENRNWMTPKIPASTLSPEIDAPANGKR